MFFNLLLIVMLFGPLPAIYSAISKREKPYFAIGYGITSGTLAILIIFALAFLMGQSFGSQMDTQIDNMVSVIVNNKEMLSAVGLEQVSSAKAVATLTDLYKSFAVLFPSVLIIFVTIISYIEYNIMVRVRYAQSSGYRPYAYLRNFALRNNDVMGWFLIYLVGYLMKFAGIGIGEIAVMNINVLVNTVISIQAMGLIFFVTYVKQRPKIFAIIITVCLWLIPMGKSILFILGLFDLLLNLRGRFRENFNG